MTLPFVLLLLDYWPLMRFGPAQASQDGEADQALSARIRLLALEKAPLMILAAFSCVLTIMAQHGSMQSIDQVDLPWRVSNAAITPITVFIASSSRSVVVLNCLCSTIGSRKVGVDSWRCRSRGRPLGTLGSPHETQCHIGNQKDRGASYIG